MHISNNKPHVLFYFINGVIHVIYKIVTHNAHQQQKAHVSFHSTTGIHNKMFSFLVKKILAAFKCIPNLYFLYYCLYNQLYNQRLYQQHTGDQTLQFSFKVIRNMNFHQYCKAKKKLTQDYAAKIFDILFLNIFSQIYIQLSFPKGISYPLQL